MIKKEKTFKYAIGEVFAVGDPIGAFYIKNCTVIQHVQPFEYPIGEFTTKNIILYPSVRNKKPRPTRKISYLLKMQDDGLFIWATEDCLKPMPILPVELIKL